MKRAATVVLALAVAWVVTAGPVASGDVFKAEMPAFIMSAGQSMDAEMIYVCAKRARLTMTYDPMATYDTIRKSGAKTLIVGFGNSGKGLGAAGVSEKAEYQRINDVLSKAKRDNIVIIGAHVGGSVRRGAITHQFMDPFLGYCNAFFCLEDSDFDGFFTRASKEHGWPLMKVPEITDLGGLLKQVFSK
ncbi:MAG: DUF6305 family protein [Firmicutes bacterium]|jgi:hypothetical protein|nr:DUF6305 family protein [Bacillota bacterium]